MPRSRAWRSPVARFAPGAGRPTPAPHIRSQAFSTSQRFAQIQVSGPCFVPQPFGIFLLQRFPLAAIVVASRRHQLPCRSSPAPPSESARALSPSVSATPPRRSWVLPLSPADYEAPFHALGLALNRCLSTAPPTLPGASGLGRPESPLGSGFVDFEALLLLRVRSHDPGLPLTRGRSSLGILPL